MSPFPKELHLPLINEGQFVKTKSLLKKRQLNTICQEAKCPNQFYCWAKKQATFLALGPKCTRACAFCATRVNFHQKLLSPDSKEPKKIALCAKKLQLKHVVITMVTRDDLPDGGASHLVKILQALKKELPDSTLEVLTSDFGGNLQALDLILKEEITIFNHNLETVRRLTPKVRDVKASYDRSLDILAYVKKKNLSQVKSGLMVGLGEKPEEVKSALRNLKKAGVDFVTIGQYLPPSSQNYPLKEFVTLEQFKKYEEFGLRLGFKGILAGPLVRSSLNAEDLV